MKQHRRWRYTLEPDGVITWISPTGEKRVTLPDHTHWPPPTPQPHGIPATPAPDRHPALPPF